MGYGFNHEGVSIFTLLDAADHWDRVAESDAEMARYNRSVGRDLSTPGRSAGDYTAEAAARCARTLRLAARTGLSHCMCHEAPLAACPSYQGGARY